MESIKSLLVLFYRAARDGDYAEELDKAIERITDLHEQETQEQRDKMFEELNSHDLTENNLALVRNLMLIDSPLKGYQMGYEDAIKTIILQKTDEDAKKTS